MGMLVSFARNRMQTITAGVIRSALRPPNSGDMNLLQIMWGYSKTKVSVMGNLTNH